MISPEEYIEQRLNDQIGWYDRKSVTNQRWFRRLRFAEISCCGALGSRICVLQIRGTRSETGFRRKFECGSGKREPRG